MKNILSFLVMVIMISTIPYIFCQEKLSPDSSQEEIMDDGEKAFLMGKKFETEKKYNEAKKWYEQAIKLNNLKAMCNLGCMYLNPDTKMKNPRKGFEYLLRAAELGELEKSAYLVGFCYCNGKGVQQDKTKAKYWVEKAVNNGCKDAYGLMGDLLFDTPPQQINNPKAISYWNMAAENGDIYAMYSLGTLYMKGNGVPKDSKKSFLYFFKAAQKNHVEAQFMVGAAYEFGEGVKCDLFEAKKWYQKALSNGYESASKALSDVNAKISQNQHSNLNEPSSSKGILDSQVIYFIRQFNVFANSLRGARLTLDDYTLSLLAPYERDLNILFPNGLKYYDPSDADGYIKKRILQNIYMTIIDIKCGLKMLRLDLNRATELENSANTYFREALQMSNAFLHDK